ncbi:DUF3349 domain-containing protein [Mycobacterium sp. M23085]|uniref:DUF3349 domain-containing protein n=1 Tax=Mycobacterium sp. M23085 TaxID=3378087 RepID=UPI003877B04B
MSLRDRVSGVVTFLRAGYPKWAPDVGYSPLLALLPRRVSDDELVAIVKRLLTTRRSGIDSADVGVEIIGVTDEMPSADEIERVLVAVRSGRQDG